MQEVYYKIATIWPQHIQHNFFHNMKMYYDKVTCSYVFDSGNPVVIFDKNIAIACTIKSSVDKEKSKTIASVYPLLFSDYSENQKACIDFYESLPESSELKHRLFLYAFFNKAVIKILIICLSHNFEKDSVICLYKSALTSLQNFFLEKKLTSKKFNSNVELSVLLKKLFYQDNYNEYNPLIGEKFLSAQSFKFFVDMFLKKSSLGDSFEPCCDDDWIFFLITKCFQEKLFEDSLDVIKIKNLGQQRLYACLVVQMLGNYNHFLQEYKKLKADNNLWIDYCKMFWKDFLANTFSSIDYNKLSGQGGCSLYAVDDMAYAGCDASKVTISKINHLQAKKYDVLSLVGWLESYYSPTLINASDSSR